MLVHFRPILKAYGLTEQQWRILRGLDDCGAMEQRLLCDLCQILGPSLAGILTRMEEMGLIERAKVPNDQRRVMVALGPRAPDLLAEVKPLVAAQYAIMEQAIGADEIAELCRRLERMLTFQDHPVAQVAVPATAPHADDGGDTTQS